MGGGGDMFLFAFARRLRNEGNDSRRKRSLRVSAASPKSDGTAAETGEHSNEETIRGESTGEWEGDTFDVGVAPLLIALKGSRTISWTAGEGG